MYRICLITRYSVKTKLSIAVPIEFHAQNKHCIFTCIQVCMSPVPTLLNPNRQYKPLSRRRRCRSCPGQCRQETRATWEQIAGQDVVRHRACGITVSSWPLLCPSYIVCLSLSVSVRNEWDCVDGFGMVLECFAFSKFSFHDTGIPN